MRGWRREFAALEGARPEVGSAAGDDVRWRQAVPLGQATLIDQDKLAVVLQAAILLAHCRAAGLCFGEAEDAWSGVRVDREGLLLWTGPRRGRFAAPTQTLLSDLLRRLFRSEGAIQGRGAARRAARVLLERWRQELLPLPPDEAVGEILDAAPFLRAAACAGVRLAPPVHAMGSFTRGRYREALEQLKEAPAQDAGAVLLRLRCQLELGERHAAWKTLPSLENLDLDLEQALEAAELAIRLCAGRQDLAGVALRAERLRARVAGQGPEVAARAALVFAGAAWDSGDVVAMERELEAARPLAEHAELGWRWHQLRGLRGLAVSDGLTATEAFARALAWRRRCLPHQAGRLWNDLAVARALADDLPGAERACRHSWRLLRRCDGPAAVTLPLRNLAEIRVRRGRFAGVETTLERSLQEDRAAANSRGLIHDLTLCARLELGLGRPQAALARCLEAEQLLPAARRAGGLPILAVLAGRAYGWLGQQTAAGDALDRGLAAVGELEPEERPALFAHAGLSDAARLEAHGTRHGDLWLAALTGAPPGTEAWATLDALEPYRAARMVLDLELIAPGCAPPERRRQAIVELRRAGAIPLAEKLEQQGQRLPRALRAYAAQTPGLQGAAELLRASGYPEAGLAYRDEAGLRHWLLEPAAAEVSSTLALPWGAGELLLTAAIGDPALEALHALLRRDLRPPGAETAEPRQMPGAVAQPVHGYGRPPRPAGDEGERGRADGIVGRDSGLMRALDRLDRLAVGDLPILILGESGCGKEAMARRSHRLSRRRQGPFLAVNCAALSESLILSDLFGHVRGAFTGAERDRAGIFEAARGGTVFLDEIGDLPLSCQGHLLRVLQESEIRRVGESVARKVDVRIVTATHQDLAAQVEAGRFRQDLYFRLKVAKIDLPPLRERADDIVPLAQHFLGGVAGAPCRLTPEAEAMLRAYPWPGNIRELKNVLEVAAALADDGKITPAELELPVAPAAAKALATGNFHQQLDAFRRGLLHAALNESGGNRARAARILGLTRQALSYHARQLGMF
jgi:DNA-binding NtrC family response regulator